MAAELLEAEMNSQDANTITDTYSAMLYPITVPLNKCMLTELNEIELSKIGIPHVNCR